MTQKDSTECNIMTNVDPLLEIITEKPPGVRYDPYFTHKQENLSRHLQHTRQEFFGKPEVCAKVMEHIVCIRRQYEIEKNLTVLDTLVHRYQDVLCEHLTSRWLLSIIDTYAVYGKPEFRAAALSVTTFMNLLILADTVLIAEEVDEITDKPFDPYGPDTVLPYGCITYNMQSGDNLSNLLRMITYNMQHAGVVKTIWNTLFERIKSTDNLITKLRKNHHAPNGGHRFY